MTNRAEIEALGRKTRAVVEEFDSVIMFHETWKPSAFDQAVLGQMGKSYATHAFHIIRAALRREVVLGISRLWDAHPNSDSFRSITIMLQNGRLIDALAAEREADYRDSPINLVNRLRGGERKSFIKFICETKTRDAPLEGVKFRAQVKDVLDLIESYDRDLTFQKTLCLIKNVRDKRLAHRDKKAASTTGTDILDSQVEDLYQKMFALLRMLRLATENASYDPLKTARIHAQYAQLFWRSVKGEKTPGHPDYVNRDNDSSGSDEA